MFGRNYDWVSDAGLLCTNLKGLYKTSVPRPEGPPISWVSKFGSITFNHYGLQGILMETSTGLPVDVNNLDLAAIISNAIERAENYSAAD